MREFPVTVEAIVPHGVEGRVREYVLAPHPGARLPVHEPGAHLFVHTGRSINAYSLLDDGVLP
ncbi:MAG: hypothetical protein ACTHQE_14015, partial [Thermomicrobiales bacterium]